MRTHSRVYTFRTRETQTGPGALSTPGTAVFTGRRGVRGRRLPPLSGRSLPPRRYSPARDVKVTRHQQGFPGSRPSGLSPRLWPPWLGQRPLGSSVSFAPSRSGTGHARHGGDRSNTTCSYVPGISQTSSTSSLTACDLVSQPPPFPRPPSPEGTAACRPGVLLHQGRGVMSVWVSGSGGGLIGRPARGLRSDLLSRRNAPTAPATIPGRSGRCCRSRQMRCS